MQQFVKQRATETGDITFNTPAIDVSAQPLLVNELIVYSMAGTSPDITATLQTSSDMLTWSDVSGVDLQRTSAGSSIKAVLASSNPYVRYVRFTIVISGTTTSIEYSLVLNSFPSS